MPLLYVCLICVHITEMFTKLCSVVVSVLFLTFSSDLLGLDLINFPVNLDIHMRVALSTAVIYV